MLPRWHIFFGAIFTLIVYFLFPQTNLIYLVLMFLSSFLIDFDHYVSAGLNTGKVLTISEALEYYKKDGVRANHEKKRGIKRRGDFHVFHTIEFHLMVLLLSLVWVGFFYIFLGMIFHSLFDLVYLIAIDFLYRREYFMVNRIRRIIK
jgi:hypothetical protein